MKWFFLVLFLLIGGLGIGVFLHYNQVATHALSETQKTQAVKELLGRSINTGKDESPREYTGTFITFSYPAWVTVDTRDQDLPKKNPSILEIFELRDPETHLFVVVQVAKASFSNLAGDSSVALRRKQQDLYRESPMTLSGKPGVLFTKNENGAEKSIFVLAGGKEYTLAASALSMERIDGILPQILTSFRIH